MTEGLPTSRTDALSIVCIGIFTVFVGESPAKGKKLAILVTVLANLWAITSSVLTLLDIHENQHTTEPHLRVFTFILLIMTMTTSSFAVLSFIICHDEFRAFAAVLGLFTLPIAFVFGLVELVLTYVNRNAPQ